MNDPRIFGRGYEIPSEGYCDQPYVVKTADGHWLCTMTTGTGREGDTGQHIVSTRSRDQGKTWSAHVDIEPADGPEASWVMPYVTAYGRVYAFYTYNAENRREVHGIDDHGNAKVFRRVDTLGEYAFKFSEDGGLTWSQERFFIPVRAMEIDRKNPYGGDVRFFWGVGKPVDIGDAMYLGFAKVGEFGPGFMFTSEGCFLKCDNINTERDPDSLSWETLPEGDHGLRSPEGQVADEANLTWLSDGALFCTYRTTAGHPCHAYSRDGGKSWTPPAFMTQYPSGPLLNHPRAANFVRRLSDGRFIYWYHNNVCRTYNHGEAAGSRNPAWLLGGVERESSEGLVIHWGLPQVVLYEDHPHAGISYPDFIEENGQLFITATNKESARVNSVDLRLIDQLYVDL